VPRVEEGLNGSGVELRLASREQVDPPKPLALSMSVNSTTDPTAEEERQPC